MGSCSVCHRVLYDEDVASFGPVCADCLAKEAGVKDLHAELEELRIVTDREFEPEPGEVPSVKPLPPKEGKRK